MKKETERKLNRAIAAGTAMLTPLTLTACGQQEMPPQDLTVKSDFAAEESPNVVYIVLDDLGYSDFGCYGSSIETPNIDQLARRGIQYNNYFTMPLSSPARAALLTGCDANTVGMGSVSDINLDKDVPNMMGCIRPEHGTIANILQENGYATMQAGKWHIAPYDQFTPDGDHSVWPSGKGFDYNFTFIPSQTNQFHPGSMLLGDDYVDVEPDAGYHLTEDLVDHSLQFIDEAKKQDPEKPFFLYFAPGAMHAPLQAPKEYIEKYRGKFAHGWDEERQRRLENQIGLGMFPEGTELPEPDWKVDAWDSLSETEKTVAQRHMEVYAGYLEHTDAQIGRLFEELKARDEYDNTIFVLVADNGATSEGGRYGTQTGQAAENNIRLTAEEQLPLIDQYGGEIYGTEKNVGWAMASNTPYKLYKFTAFFGGIKVPCIVSWEDGLKEHGTMEDQMISVMDVTPTVLDILDIDQPEEIHGVEQAPMQGSSFAPDLLGQQAPQKKEIWTMMANEMGLVSSDGWAASFNTKENTWELFDLSSDPTQAHNVAAENPKQLKKMKNRYEQLKKDRYGACNLLMDLAQGVAAPKLILRYGLTPLYISNTVFKGKPPKNELTEKVVGQLEVMVSLNGLAPLIYNPDGSPLAARDYTYDPAKTPFFTSLAAAQTNCVSHEIQIDVTATGEDQGVILANGGLDGGYVFYVRDGRLVYEYNYAGAWEEMVSSIPLPEGRSTIALTYEKKDAYNGHAVLKVNGEIGAEMELKSLPIFTSYDYISFGLDAGAPVSRYYEGGNPFTGTVEEVRVHLGDDMMQNNG